MRTPRHKLAHGEAVHRGRSRGLAEPVAGAALPSEVGLPELPDGATFREHADALFGDARDGITLQLDGRIVYANRRMAELIGFREPAGLLGLSSLHFYSEDDLARALARMQSTFFGRPSTPARHELLRVDGTAIPVEATCLLLRVSRENVLIEIVRDVGAEQMN